jgi:hypothetical protein
MNMAKADRELLAANGLCYDCKQDKGAETGVRCTPCKLINRGRAKASANRNRPTQVEEVIADPERAARTIASMRAKIAALRRFITQAEVSTSRVRRRAPGHTKYFPAAKDPATRLRRLEEIEAVALPEADRPRIYQARKYWRRVARETA